MNNLKLILFCIYISPWALAAALFWLMPGNPVPLERNLNGKQRHIKIVLGRVVRIAVVWLARISESVGRLMGGKRGRVR